MSKGLRNARTSTFTLSNAFSVVSMVGAIKGSGCVFPCLLVLLFGLVGIAVFMTSISSTISEMF